MGFAYCNVIPEEGYAASSLFGKTVILEIEKKGQGVQRYSGHVDYEEYSTAAYSAYFAETYDALYFYENAITLAINDDITEVGDSLKVKVSFTDTPLPEPTLDDVYKALVLDGDGYYTYSDILPNYTRDDVGKELSVVANGPYSAKLAFVDKRKIHVSLTVSNGSVTNVEARDMKNRPISGVTLADIFDSGWENVAMIDLHTDAQGVGNVNDLCLDYIVNGQDFYCHKYVWTSVLHREEFFKFTLSSQGAMSGLAKGTMDMTIS